MLPYAAASRSRALAAARLAAAALVAFAFAATAAQALMPRPPRLTIVLAGSHGVCPYVRVRPIAGGGPGWSLASSGRPCTVENAFLRTGGFTVSAPGYRPLAVKLAMFQLRTVTLVPRR